MQSPLVNAFGANLLHFPISAILPKRQNDILKTGPKRYVDQQKNDFGSPRLCRFVNAFGVVFLHFTILCALSYDETGNKGKQRKAKVNNGQGCESRGTEANKRKQMETKEQKGKQKGTNGTNENIGRLTKPKAN